MANPIKVINEFVEQQNRIADFVQNGPDDGIPGHIRDQYRKRCEQFANLPGWAQALGNGSTGTMDRICDPYLGDNGWDGPENPGPPFGGGQCQDIGYQAFLTGPSGNPGVPGNSDRQGLGPVGGICFVDQGFGNFSIGVTFQGVCQISGGGQATTTEPDGWSIVNVVRIDGQPDLCGDPPDLPLRPGPNPPPDPGPTPGPEPRDDPFGGPIPELPIPPFDDPIFGPIPIDPSDDGGGGGGDGGEPQPPAGGDGLPGAPDSVGPPAGQTGNDGEGEDFDFGEPPEGKVWVGMLIENTVDSRYGNIPGTGPQNTVYPYVIGNASLIYTGGYSSSSRMRSRWHEMYRPVTALQVTGARVQCRPGVSASVRPVSATICPENTCTGNTNG